MARLFTNIALTGNWRDPKAGESIATLSAHLLERGCSVNVGGAYRGPELPGTVRRADDDTLMDGAELMIAVGGDGTMLYAARFAVDATVPLLGINRGRLGFLADVSPAEMLAAVDQVLAGDCEREQRRLLHAEVESESGNASGTALNDVVVKRLDSGRMFEFQTLVNDVYVNTHGGDGFIVATPTGSTAYALSCGGPILTPQLDALVLAPICPHTLSDRPIVIPGNSRAEIRLRERDEDAAAVCCDGDVIGHIGAGDRLLVTASDARLELIHPPGYDFYEILRGKLHWGRSNRQSQRPG
ncbi:MAG: NAD(+)/NADH kinase [Chromatiales bacterium]|nr:MAG: NAD(+)/NADH kinase [Chromatiales bacterium]